MWKGLPGTLGVRAIHSSPVSSCSPTFGQEMCRHVSRVPPGSTAPMTGCENSADLYASCTVAQELYGIAWLPFTCTTGWTAITSAKRSASA